jgi:hypothetical protein
VIPAAVRAASTNSDVLRSSNFETSRRLKRRAASCTAIGQVELLFSFASMTRLLAAHRLKAQRLEQRDPG